LRTKLTVASLGMEWQQRPAHGSAYFATNEAHGLLLYVSGRICIVTDDAALMLDMIQKQEQPKTAAAQPALMLAGFDHAAARGGFAQWTAVVDGLSHKHAAKPDAGSPAVAAETDAGETPPFFGKDMKSLSDAFAAMKQERFVARHDGALMRQTVTYTWQR
jgi:enamine deaminase RidA (YjgF/YER057c/UK114 family)